MENKLVNIRCGQAEVHLVCTFFERVLTGGLTSAISKGFSGQNTSKQLLAGAVTGGVVAKIYGTSFTDGFFDGMATAAFVHVFNDRIHSKGLEKVFESRNVPVERRTGAPDEPKFDSLSDREALQVAQDVSDLIVREGQIEGGWIFQTIGATVAGAAVGAAAGLALQGIALSGLASGSAYFGANQLTFPFSSCGKIRDAFSEGFRNHTMRAGQRTPNIEFIRVEKTFGHVYPAFRLGKREYWLSPWFRGNTTVYPLNK